MAHSERVAFKIVSSFYLHTLTPKCTERQRVEGGRQGRWKNVQQSEASRDRNVGEQRCTVLTVFGRHTYKSSLGSLLPP
jgi:hypothetical protein